MFVVFSEKSGNLFVWNFKHTPKMYVQCHILHLTMSHSQEVLHNVLQSKDESMILGRRFAFPRRNQHYARPDI